MKKFFSFLKTALYDDIIDRTLFILTIVLLGISYLIWSKYLDRPDLFVYLRVNIYPIKMLASVVAINTILAISSHDKEKEIGYFLFISNILLCLLILSLETFYLINL